MSCKRPSKDIFRSNKFITLHREPIKKYNSIKKLDSNAYLKYNFIFQMIINDKAPTKRISA
jgi:hypothetical protein